MEVAATCSEPPSLTGSALTEVSDEDFNCGRFSDLFWHRLRYGLQTIDFWK